MNTSEKVTATIDLILYGAAAIIIYDIIMKVITQVNIDLTCIYP